MDPVTRQAQLLVHYGVPFDVAYAIHECGPEGEAEALAWSILHGEFEGGRWSWDRMEWERD